VPAPRSGGAFAPIVEVTEGERIAVRISTANCDPSSLCILEGGVL
jgi:hypothetical protein